MQLLTEIYNNLGIYIVSALAIIVIILFILVISNVRALNKLENKYRRLMRGVSNENLEELIKVYLDKVDTARSEVEEIKNVYNEVDKRLKDCIQNVSIIRYKAFDDVGSDLSFSIALLDDNKDGVIITSIYGRSESTTYAKPIDKGISRYDLSEEEEQVLRNAMAQK